MFLCKPLVFISIYHILLYIIIYFIIYNLFNFISFIFIYFYLFTFFWGGAGGGGQNVLTVHGILLNRRLRHSCSWVIPASSGLLSYTITPYVLAAYISREIYFHFGQWLGSSGSAITHPPGCFCPWTFSLHVGLNMLPLVYYVMFRFFTRIFRWGVPGFANYCPCGVWSRKDGTKPLPKPVFTFHQLCKVKPVLGQFYKRYFSHQSLKWAWKSLI